MPGVGYKGPLGSDFVADAEKAHGIVKLLKGEVSALDKANHKAQLAGKLDPNKVREVDRKRGQLEQIQRAERVQREAKKADKALKDMDVSAVKFGKKLAKTIAETGSFNPDRFLHHLMTGQVEDSLLTIQDKLKDVSMRRGMLGKLARSGSNLAGGLAVGVGLASRLAGPAALAYLAYKSVQEGFEDAASEEKQDSEVNSLYRQGRISKKQWQQFQDSRSWTITGFTHDHDKVYKDLQDSLKGSASIRTTGTPTASIRKAFQEANPNFNRFTNEGTYSGRKYTKDPLDFYSKTLADYIGGSLEVERKNRGSNLTDEEADKIISEVLTKFVNENHVDKEKFFESLEKDKKAVEQQRKNEEKERKEHPEKFAAQDYSENYYRMYNQVLVERQFRMRGTPTY